MMNYKEAAMACFEVLSRICLKRMMKEEEIVKIDGLQADGHT
jgi:hypothetical protein